MYMCQCVYLKIMQSVTPLPLTLRWPKRILTQRNRWLDPEAIGFSRTIHRHARRSTNVAPLSIEVHKRLRKTARAPVVFVVLFGIRRRSGTGGTRDDAVLAYMEAATKWAELHTLGWENGCGSHPQQHRRVWFKFVDLVTRIGSARLRCTEFEVFHHFYTEIGFEKYYFGKKCLHVFILISCIKFR